MRSYCLSAHFSFLEYMKDVCSFKDVRAVSYFCLTRSLQGSLFAMLLYVCVDESAIVYKESLLHRYITDFLTHCIGYK